VGFQLTIAFAATTAAGYLMIASGFRHRLIERTRTRVCPACGRPIVHRVCDRCASTDAD
jgi:hypothetical protein